MKTNVVSTAILFVFFLIWVLSACTPTTVIYPESATPKAHTPPPKGLVEVIDIIPTIRLDIRYATSNNFIGQVMVGYGAPRAFLLPKVAEQLKKVQAELQKKSLSLKIYDAYRPMRTELAMIDWAKNTGNDDYLTYGYLNTNVKKTNSFGHSSGNAVDLTIVDSHEKELDMGTEFDDFSKASWTLNATGSVLKNRLLLKNTMEKYGFTNFSREWWHYNYWNLRGKTLDEPIH
ncbi:MAG: D-alanyl-D-alanine carboxypeptidase family protein [Spirochaetales bacterium]|nr:D-alanyl-D-alanine carboxypeptidase family protein [Spirochaetales bacterium]